MKQIRPFGFQHPATKPMPLLLGLCFLWVAPLLGQGVADSLTQLLQTTLSDTARCEVLVQLASAQQQKGDYRRAEQTAREAYRLSVQKLSAGQQAMASMRLGTILCDRSQHKEALDFLFKAAENFNKANDQLNRARALNNVAAVYHELQQYPLVLQYMEQALQIVEKLQAKPAMAVISGNLGNLYAQSGDFNKAQQLIERSLALKKELGDRQGESYSLNFLGGIYEKQGNTKEALNIYTQALAIEKAIGEPYLMTHSYQHIGDLHKQQGNLQQAKNYYDSAAVSAQNIGATKELAQVYLAYAELDSVAGKFREAYQWYKRHKQLSDSVFNSERSKQIAELQTRYEVSEKENEIAQLSQQTQIQELQIQRRNVLMASGALLAVVILAAVGIYNRNRRLTMQASLLETEQRWRRAQMNPHFFFNALMAIQQYVNRAETLTASSYIARFARLMRRVLDSSEKEFTVLSEELETLQAYIDLQRIRFEQPFDYQVSIDDETDADEVQIPVMLLQPLVENAIEHGLRGLATGGKLHLDIRTKGEQLLIRLTDNGIGRQAASHLRRKEHISRATTITEDRIRLLEKQAGFKVIFHIRDLEQGTAASLQMLLKYIT
ncbi:tetratricopeptide repeat protein [Rhodoflexus caldus]|uniref:tetratricopeptide repeat protein n=1 Tax=Rhodoflexus caldus TaxID=2891236 RepID=UPI002029C738|nr:tetratricopeptide repeat protein [Rhodoflexus caldus]